MLWLRTQHAGQFVTQFDRVEGLGQKALGTCLDQEFVVDIDGAGDQQKLAAGRGGIAFDRLGRRDPVHA